MSDIPYNVCLSCGQSMCDHAMCLDCEGCNECEFIDLLNAPLFEELDRIKSSYQFPVVAMLPDSQADRNAQRVRGSESAAPAEGQQKNRTPSRPSAQVSVAQTADAGDAHAMPESRPVAQSASPDFYPPERRIRDRQLADHLQFMEGA